MTELQVMRVRALAAANLGANDRARMFVKDMLWKMEKDSRRALTERQIGYLKGLCWRFRRQIPAALRPAQNPFDPSLWRDGEDMELVSVGAIEEPTPAMAQEEML
jgi:hypothetical protein